MNSTRNRAIGEYLRQLQRHMHELPADRRNEILAEIEEHITEGLAAFETPTEADILNVLDRVGDPQEIAAEARDELAAATESTSAPRKRRIHWGVVVGLFVIALGSGVGVILLQGTNGDERNTPIHVDGAIDDPALKEQATAIVGNIFAGIRARATGLRSDDGGQAVGRGTSRGDLRLRVDLRIIRIHG